MIINHKELHNLIKYDLNIRGDNIIVTKSTYEPITKDVFTTKILPKYWNWLSVMQLTEWKNQWNCVNFSEAFRVFACAYYNSLKTNAADSIPIGIIQYYSEKRPENETAGYHSMNIAIIEENNTNKGIFIEPQNCKIIDLNPREIVSIKMLYI